MPDMFMDVDTALSEVPVNLMPLIDDTDFKTRKTAVAYNAAGMDLVWNFCTTGGAYTQTAVTPTSGGSYDWTHQGDGMYSIEIPASGGASINNDTEGFGWFTGVATGCLPWRGPVIGFRAAAINNSLIDGTTIDVNVTTVATGAITAGAIAADAIGASELAADAATEIATAVWATATRSLTVLDEDSTTIDLDATVRAAVGLAAADLDTQLAALPTAGENADAVWDEQVDGSVTARESVRLANSALGGKVSGAETNSVVIRDLADTKDRITATVDADGNRSAVTRDLT